MSKLLTFRGLFVVALLAGGGYACPVASAAPAEAAGDAQAPTRPGIRSHAAASRREPAEIRRRSAQGDLRANDRDPSRFEPMADRQAGPSQGTQGRQIARRTDCRLGTEDKKRHRQRERAERGVQGIDHRQRGPAYGDLHGVDPHAHQWAQPPNCAANPPIDDRGISPRLRKPPAKLLSAAFRREIARRQTDCSATAPDSTASASNRPLPNRPLPIRPTPSRRRLEPTPTRRTCCIA